MLLDFLNFVLKTNRNVALPETILHVVTAEKYMADNSSVGGKSSMRPVNERLIIVEVLVTVFLCINFLLIMTFFKNDFFRTSMRYIFFANTLLCDSLYLMLTNILLIFIYFHITMQVWLCIIIYIVASLYTFITPITLTAMTLERYVAICMPLRHGQLCTPRSTLHCILIINGLSVIPMVIFLSICFATVTYSFYTSYRVCAVQVFIIFRWQDHLRSAINQLYFFVMAVTIFFSYVKIMKAAKVASGENKKSSWKGLRTVMLHGFQLLLCLIQLWCPFIEAAVLQIDLILFINVRYIDYITFILAPRCLSPLIYGLRDKKFFLALKYYAFFGLNKKISRRF